MSPRTRRGAPSEGEKERKGSIAEFIKSKRESQLLEKSMGRNNKILRSPEGEEKAEEDKGLGAEKEGGKGSRRRKFQKWRRTRKWRRLKTLC